ncbi:protein SIS [Salix suchowensis]|nr:protein SIS [Salix suchowensis]
MAIIPIPFSPLSTTPPRAFFKPLHLPTLPAIRISNDPWRRRRRGLIVVTRAGLSANSYVLAFLLPLSLLAATIFTSIKIADKLDQDYLEELEIIQAIKEADEEDDDSDDGEEEDDDVDHEEDDGNTADISLEEELQPVLQRARTRNRPKREA